MRRLKDDDKAQAEMRDAWDDPFDDLDSAGPSRLAMMLLAWIAIAIAIGGPLILMAIILHDALTSVGVV